MWGGHLGGAWGGTQWTNAFLLSSASPNRLTMRQNLPRRKRFLQPPCPLALLLPLGPPLAPPPPWPTALLPHHEAGTVPVKALLPPLRSSSVRAERDDQKVGS